MLVPFPWKESDFSSQWSSTGNEQENFLLRSISELCSFIQRAIQVSRRVSVSFSLCISHSLFLSLLLSSSLPIFPSLSPFLLPSLSSPHPLPPPFRKALWAGKCPRPASVARISLLLIRSCRANTAFTLVLGGWSWLSVEWCFVIANDQCTELSWHQ